MTLLLFIVVFSVLVLVHECGHFFSARLLHITVEEFGIGFPPRLFSIKTKRGMIWSLNAIPIGGFVRLEGEDGTPSPRSFAVQPIYKRMIVISSGVIMNVLLAYCITVLLLTVGSPMVNSDLPANAHLKEQYIAIAGVLENSPASSAQIHSGDRVLSIDGTSIQTTDQMQSTIRTNPDNTHVIILKRDAQEVTVSLKPTKLENKQWGIGVELLPIAIVQFPFGSAIIQSAIITGEQFLGIAQGFGEFLQRLVTSGKVSEDVVGPVGIAHIVANARQNGWATLASLVTVLSLNLALINILPIPALDGGRLFFLIIEAIRRKPIRILWETTIHQIGFIALLLLMVLITIKDILH